MLIVAMLHSLWRWVVLVLAILAIIKTFAGWFRKQGWTNLDKRLGLFYTVAFDIQFLLGIILYTGVLVKVYSPRWFNESIERLSAEHVVLMLIALVIAHVALSRSKKAGTSLAKHQTVAIGFVISLALIIAGIPTWNFQF